MSWNCSNQTKLCVEYNHCSQSVKQKEFLIYFAKEEKEIILRKIANFAISEF